MNSIKVHNNYESLNEKEEERQHEVPKGGEGVVVDLDVIIQKLKKGGRGQQRNYATKNMNRNGTPTEFSEAMKKQVIQDVTRTMARQADAAQEKQTDVHVSPTGRASKKLSGGTQPGADVHI